MPVPWVNGIIVKSMGGESWPPLILVKHGEAMLMLIADPSNLRICVKVSMVDLQQHIIHIHNHQSEPSPMQVLMMRSDKMVWWCQKTTNINKHITKNITKHPEISIKMMKSSVFFSSTPSHHPPWKSTRYTSGAPSPPAATSSKIRQVLRPNPRHLPHKPARKFRRFFEIPSDKPPGIHMYIYIYSRWFSYIYLVYWYVFGIIGKNYQSQPNWDWSLPTCRSRQRNRGDVI